MSLNEVKVSVSRLEEQMKGLRELIEKQFQGLNDVLDLRAQQWNAENAARDKKIETLDKRQRTVEKKVNLFSGAGGVLGTIFGAIAVTVSERLFHG